MSSKEFFDEVASEWDRMRQTYYSESVREKAYAAAGVEPGRTAADVGAGTGFITEGLLKRGLKVIAVDQSEAMLGEIQKKFAATGQVECRAGEAEHLPVADASVDYVFANMYLHHVESPPQAIRELARILKAGGRLVLTDADEHHFEFLRVEHHDRWLGFKREEVACWFEQAGLRKIATDGLGENCMVSSEHGPEVATIGIFIAIGEK